VAPVWATGAFTFHTPIPIYDDLAAVQAVATFGALMHLCKGTFDAQIAPGCACKGRFRTQIGARLTSKMEE